MCYTRISYATYSVIFRSLNLFPIKLDTLVAVGPSKFYAPHSCCGLITWWDETSQDWKSWLLEWNAAWRGRGTNDIPCPRSMHVGVIWCNKLCIYGGNNGLRQMNDLHLFDFSSNFWKTTVKSGFRQTCRDRHTAVIFDLLLIIFGGFDGRTALNGKLICELRMSE